MAESRYVEHTRGMPEWNSFSYAFGPMFALLGLLFVIWMLKRAGFDNKPDPDEPDPIRAPIIGPMSWADAHRVAQQLKDAGHDAGISDQGDGFRVTVPADDVAPARQVIWSQLFPGS